MGRLDNIFVISLHRARDLSAKGWPVEFNAGDHAIAGYLPVSAIIEFAEAQILILIADTEKTILATVSPAAQKAWEALKRSGYIRMAAK